MNTKTIVFLAHDPGGYDVVYPVVKKYKDAGIAIEFYCIGPAARLNPFFATDETEALKIIQQKIYNNTISALITGTSWGNDIELQAINLCKNAHIVTVSILDYWSNYASRLSDQNGKFVFPDYYVVMDELAKNEVVMEGVPGEILQVLGHPGLDRFVQNRNVKKTHQPESPKILFLSQPLSQLYGDTLGYTERDVLYDCLNAINGKSNWNFNVKFHPKDDPEFQSLYANLSVKGELIDLLPVYDIVIGMNTMGLLHAVLMGVSAISYQPNLQKPDLCITNKLNLTRLVTNYEDLRQELDKIDKRQLNEIPVDQYIWFDGKSLERVFCFLQEVIPNYEH